MGQAHSFVHVTVCHDSRQLPSCCRFIPLLFTLLSSPSETLKGAAADVLTEIISKRMEPQNKLGLIQQLGLGRVCAQWGNGLPVQDGEYELATRYAKLLATIVTGRPKKTIFCSNILCEKECHSFCIHQTFGQLMTDMPDCQPGDQRWCQNSHVLVLTCVLTFNEYTDNRQLSKSCTCYGFHICADNQ